MFICVAAASFLLTMGVGALSAGAQAIQPVASGNVQSVKAGITATATAGTIARSQGGERSGEGGFGTTETKARVVTGITPGYGRAQIAGRQTEYGWQTSGGFGAGGDFPESDFVATMPGPGVSAPSLGSGASSGLGVSLSAAAPSGGSSHRGGHAVARRSAHGARNPEAILNPFTHSIGGGLGSSGSVATGLGAAH